MKNKTFVLMFCILWTSPVLAQIYTDKYDTMIAPMEHAVDNSREYTANVRSPGASEDDKPASQRYEENVGTMNEVTDKHFIVAVDGKIPDKNEVKP